MPFNKYRQKCHMKMVSAVLNVGGNAYSQAARPQLIFPCKDILSIEDIQAWSDIGYKVEVITKVNGLVTVRVRVPGSATNLAAHSHDITVSAAAGTQPTKTGGTNDICDGAGTTISAYNAVTHKDSGVVPSSLANITNPITGGPELSTGVNSAFNIYGLAIGYN